MKPNDTPWFGLESGKTDTRRVDALARWNWFWAVMPQKDAALVLQLNGLPKSAPVLPKLRSIEVRFQALLGTNILYIRLKDSSHLELFETLCRDVMAVAELADTEAEALERAIGRTFRWHYLLRAGRLEVLPEDEQKGLIGEIEVLKLLAVDIGPKAAVMAWMGPSGAPKDFELRANCIEVKARRGASQPFVKIASEYQLADVPDRNIWLAVLSVDKVHAPHGWTLTDYVDDVTKLIERTDPSIIKEWLLRLCDAGYDPMHDYSAVRWMASAPDLYLVADGFPRLVPPVSLGVSGVTYALALSACGPFRMEWDRFRPRLIEESQS